MQRKIRNGPFLPFEEVLTDDAQLEDGLVGVVEQAENFPHLCTGRARLFDGGRSSALP